MRMRSVLWLVATSRAAVVDGGILFIAAMSQSGLSVRDLVQPNTLFGAVLELDVALACAGWKLLPAREAVRGPRI